MPTEVLNIPLLPGLNDSVDPSLLEVGKIKTLRNGRFRKVGRVGKRNGVTTVTKTAVNGTITGKPNACELWRDNPVIVSDCAVLTYVASADKWFQPNDLGVSRFTPVRRDPVIRNENQSGVLNVSAAYVPIADSSSNLCVYVWDDDTNVYLQAQNARGQIVFRTTVATSSKFARVVAVANLCWVVYKTGTTVNARSFNADTLSVSGATSVGTLSASTDKLDAAPFSSTQWLLVYQSAGAVLTAKLMTGTTTSASQTVATGGTCKGVTIMGQPSKNIYVAFNEVVSPACAVEVFNASLSASVGGPTIVTADATLLGMPGLVMLASGTSAMLVTSGFDTTASVFSTWTQWATVSNTAVVSGLSSKFWHMSLASKPFQVGTRFFTWVDTSTSSSAGTGWELQRTHWLIELFAAGGGTRPRMCMHTWPTLSVDYGGSKTTDSRSHLAEVLNLSDQANPYWIFPASIILRAARDAAPADELVAVDAIQFRDESVSMRAAHRQAIRGGEGLCFTGGLITEFANVTFENGFTHFPVILQTTVSAGGSVDTGDHYYSVVFEYIDPLGRRHRSAPSVAKKVTTTAGNNTVGIRFTTLNGGKADIAQGSVVAHVYRTKLGETISHRVTPNTGAPLASGTAGTVLFTDTSADVAITSAETLYTDSGTLGNLIPPAAEFGCEGGARFWLAGALYRDRVYYSKPRDPGQPYEFPDVSDGSNTILFPEEITAIAYGDGALIAWSTTGAYVVTGEGPNRQGQQGSFSAPRRLPNVDGCRDWHGVQEVPQGWIYQGTRCFQLLPRGFGSSVPVGLDIQETTNAYQYVFNSCRVRRRPNNDWLSSQLVDPGLEEVRWMLGLLEVPSAVDLSGTTAASRVIVWDTSLAKFVSVDDTLGASMVGPWSDSTAVLLAADLSSGIAIQKESMLAWGSSNGFVQTTLTTGDIRPFGLLGTGQVHKVHLLGEWRGPAKFDVSVRVDNDQLVNRTDLVPKSVDGTTPATAGVRFYYEFHPEFDRCNSLQIEVLDKDAGGGASEGLVWLQLSLEVERAQGTRRLGSDARG